MNCEFKRAFYEALKKMCPKGKMVRVCCHCLKVMGYTDSSAPEFDGDVSHGLCDKCAKELYPELVGK